MKILKGKKWILKSATRDREDDNNRFIRNRNKSYKVDTYLYLRNNQNDKVTGWPQKIHYCDNKTIAAAECDVKRYFVNINGTELGIQQAWRGRGSQRGSGVWYRDLLDLVYWDEDKWCPGGRMILCADTMVSREKR